MVTILQYIKVSHQLILRLKQSYIANIFQFFFFFKRILTDTGRSVCLQFLVFAVHFGCHSRLCSKIYVC